MGILDEILNRVNNHNMVKDMDTFKSIMKTEFLLAMEAQGLYPGEFEITIKEDKSGLRKGTFIYFNIVYKALDLEFKSVIQVMAKDINEDNPVNLDLDTFDLPFGGEGRLPWK